MPTAAEPRPATLPLPGGRAGATVRVRPLLTGTVDGPRAFFEREPGPGGKLRAAGLSGGRSAYVRVPVPAFLVEHPGAGLLLVDTGLHPSVAVDPRQSLGRIGTRVFRDAEMRAEQAASAQLRSLGSAAADVRAVVLTHLHSDHASAISEFGDATFVLDAREWESATRHGRLRAGLEGYVPRQFDHAFDYRTIDFEAPSVGSWETFGRVVDLLGDGSVMLASTPGHTAGHVSVVLRLRERDFVVCGDAAYTRRTLTEGVLPARTVDDHVFRRSLRELQLFMRQHPDAIAVPGHDMGAWKELEPVYD